MDVILGRLRSHLVQSDAGGVLAVALVGSAAASGLRPDSDIDLLVLTRDSLSHEQRRQLVDFLLRFSGRRATVAPGRPLEVTTLVLSDVVPWSYPPVCDFLYGEWLRDDYVAGRLPERHRNPDLAVLVTTARQHAVCLVGPHPQDLLAPVPLSDLRRSMHDSVSSLVDNLVGDERNVLLTLARMVVTLETGRILAKDEAAAIVAPDLPEPQRATLSFAAAAYVGDIHDDWSRHQARARETAAHLVDRIRAHGP